VTSEELPRRPGEPSPDDVGKKGGETERPGIDEPTDLPPNTKEGLIRQPAI
jgi:hypothetical protein